MLKELKQNDQLRDVDCFYLMYGLLSYALINNT